MDKIIGKQLPKKDQDNEHWVSMSDLMAGLMMVFMFISIAYMHYVRCLLYTSPSPRDLSTSRMPSSA